MSAARWLQSELRVDRHAADSCRDLRDGHPQSLLLDGSGADGGWDAGPLLALAPRLVLEVRGDSGGAPVSDALVAIERLTRERRRVGGPAESGVAVVLAYDALDAGRLPRRSAATPRVAVLAVDQSLRWVSPGRALWTRPGSASDQPVAELERRLGDASTLSRRAPAHAVGAVHTSLPHEAYLAAVDRLRRHIHDGDVYQANLCQLFVGRCEGDEAEFFARLTRTAPAPRSAFVAAPGWAMASLSPEVFLRLRPPDRIETWPIKGTRPRGASVEADAAARADLLGSEKDRAELVMIVDLERNDLGRVCRAGSIEVGDWSLRSFATVHHLTARVSGRLREEVSSTDMLRATFPGGSISGAPKIRARQLLAGLEPTGRGLFTGSLCWFGDDGSLDSSILIRTLVFASGRFELGAGGGIVADSVAEAEWRESNDKARALATALGFDPEEAR